MNEPLYRQIYAQLRGDISAGHLKPGERIASEKELSEQFHVSRITAKKALEMLFDEGLIERFQGKGSFVAHPDVGAHLLSASSAAPPAHLIGVVLPEVSDAFGIRLLRGIESACSANRAFVVLRLSHGQQEGEEQAIRALLDLNVNALIVLPVHGEFYNPELLRVVLSGFPVVLVDRYLKGIPAPSVSTDNVKAARHLAEHLINQGHRAIAYVSPPASNTSTLEERLQGFNEAFQAQRRDRPKSAGYAMTSVYSTMPQHCDEAHIRADEQALRDFLKQHNDVGAFVAAEYNIALLIQRVRDPEPPGPTIVCFDAPDSPYEAPRFSHIRQDEEAMGRVAVELALQDGPREPIHRVVDFSFVEALHLQVNRG